jgi:hypoxanthine phosphoribosyltransferase
MKKNKPSRKPTPRERPAAEIPPPTGPSGFGALPRGQDRSRQKGTAREWSWSEFDQAVQGLAQQISKSFEPDAVVGIAHGGVFVGGAIARAMGCDFFPVRISRRSRDKQVRSSPQSFQEMPPELKGRKVLLADDVVASGDTLELARALLDKVGVDEVRTACLIGRDNYPVDWAAVVGDDLFVFPWDYLPMVEDGRFG